MDADDGPRLRRKNAEGALELLEFCGFGFSLDWDDDLVIAEPEDFEDGYSDFHTFLNQVLESELVHDWFTEVLKRRRDRNMHQCVGGPCSGQRHHGFRAGTEVLFHLGRGEWAVYVVGNDRKRAFYLGNETSEKKAKSLARTFWARRVESMMQTGAKECDFNPSPEEKRP